MPTLRGRHSTRLMDVEAVVNEWQKKGGHHARLLHPHHVIPDLLIIRRRRRPEAE